MHAYLPADPIYFNQRADCGDSCIKRWWNTPFRRETIRLPLTFRLIAVATLPPIGVNHGDFFSMM